MKQFKVRVEKPSANWHAIEIYMQANSIIDAAQDVMDSLAFMGISNESVTLLVEINNTKEFCEGGC